MLRPIPLLAEIADKEPTLLTVWIVAIALSLAAFAACSWRRWMVVLPLSVAAVWAFAIISELRDPQLGPAISEELGWSYVLQAHLAACIPFLFGFVALLRCRAHI